MVDKTQDRNDIKEMRQLFWKRVEGKISHEKLMEELGKISGKQGNLIKEEVSMQVSE